MCSIGLMVSSKPDLKQQFQSFMKLTTHRGPDNSSTKLLSDNVIIGSNRLNIVDNDPKSNQPMSINGLTISFNGAIYNYKSLRSDLKKLGYRFHTNSDTEVILNAYREYGEDCTKHFEGMWAFIIVDQVRSIIFGSRDRYGIKPFYYSFKKNEFIVGSETKQFEGINDFDDSLDSFTLQYFLESGGFKNFSERTVYKYINQLEPGYNLEFDLNSFDLKLNKYYTLGESNWSGGELKSVLVNSIKSEIPDHELGILFSGGLDSSILNYLVQNEKAKMKSYSYINNKEVDFNESKYINDFVRRYPHSNKSISLKEDIENSIKQITNHIDEPIMSLSVIAENRLFEEISVDQIRVAFSGQGLDEIFAGYPRNLSLMRSYNPLFAFQLIWNNWTYLFEYINKKKSKNYIFTNSVFNPKKITSISEYMNYLISTNGIRDRLNYADKNSMQYSVECRVPFMNHRLVEMGYALADREKLQGGLRKGCLIKEFEQVLPRTILYRRRKLAFDTPEKFLFKNDFLDVKNEYNKAREYLPELTWSNQYSILEHGSLTLFWQLKFLNTFLAQKLN